MASFKGQDLVSGALKVAIQKVQKHTTFLNSKQLSKKERRKEKKKQRKLLRKYGSIKYNQLINKFDNSATVEAQTNESKTNSPAKIVNEDVKDKHGAVLNGAPKLLTNGKEAKDLIKLDLASSDSDLTDDECDGINPLKLLEEQIEFTTEGPQISEFAVELQGRYPCLNPEKSKTDTQPLEEPLISFTETTSDAPKQNSSAKTQSSSSNQLGTETVIQVEHEGGRAPKVKDNQSIYLELLQNRDSVKKEKILSPLKKDIVKEEEVSKKREKSLSPLKTDKVLAPPNAQKDPSYPLKAESVSQEAVFSSAVVKIPPVPSVKRSTPESNQEEHKQSPVKKLKTGRDAENVSASPKVSGISPAGSPAKIKHPDSPQLPVPKVVLFKREDIKPGWRNKASPGVGLVNLGNTCYLNSTLQVLLHTPALVNWLLEDRITGKHYAQCNRKAQTQYTHQCTICPMESLVSAVYQQKDSIRPHMIHGKLKAIGKTLSYGRQEDAHEFLRLLLESMERSYLTVVGGTRLDSRSKETSPLGQIFGGYTRGEVRCLTCRHVSTTFHPHAELQLDIRQVSSVQEGLKFYFQKETLNNDYKCEKCKTFQPATKQQFMELAPVVLCIQLKRFRMDGSKMKKPIQVDPVLNLRPHMYDKSRETNYRLVGVVNHMGSSPNCGHYTAIAQAQNGQFYNFDDSYVSPCGWKRIPESDVYVIIYEIVNRETATGNSNSDVSPNVKTFVSPHQLSNGSHKPTLNGFKISSVGSPGFKIPRRIETLNGSASMASKSGTNFPNGDNSSNRPDSKSSNSSNKPMTHRFLDRNNTSPYAANKTVNGSVNGANISSEKRNELNGTKPLSKLPVPQSSAIKTIASPLCSSDSKETSASKLLSPICKESKIESPSKMSPLSPTTKPADNEVPSKKLVQTKLPFALVTPTITSWDGSKKSTLGSLIERDRKRPFQKSREELEDEAIDAGRVKKIKKPIECRSSYGGFGPRSNPFDRVNDPSRR